MAQYLIGNIKGPKGDDGFSPKATVTQTSTGATITVEDADGITTANIRNGVDADGDPIDLTGYATKEELQDVEDSIPSLDGYATTAFVNEVVPSKLSELENDVDFVVGTNVVRSVNGMTGDVVIDIDGGGDPFVESDPTVPAWAKSPVKPTYGWTEIVDKPFNTLGEGLSVENGVLNATASGGTTYTAGAGIDITNDEISVDNTVALKTDIPDVSGFVEASDLATVATSGDYNDLTNKPDLSGFATTSALTSGLAAKQDTLTAGTNITIDANNVISAEAGSEIYKFVALDAQGLIGVTEKLQNDEYITTLKRGTIIFTLSNVTSDSHGITLEYLSYNGNDSTGKAQLWNLLTIMYNTDKTFNSAGISNIKTASQADGITVDMEDSVTGSSSTVGDNLLYIKNNYAKRTDIPSVTETDPVFTASPAYGITTEDIASWNNKSDFSGDYDDLTNKPTIPTADGTTIVDNNGVFSAVGGGAEPVGINEPFMGLFCSGNVSGYSLGDYPQNLTTIADLANSLNEYKIASVNGNSLYSNLTPAAINEAMGKNYSFTQFSYDNGASNPVSKNYYTADSTTSLVEIRSQPIFMIVNDSNVYCFKNIATARSVFGYNLLYLIRDKARTNLSGGSLYSVLGQIDTALTGKQNTLTAGDGITIENNVISASGGSSSINVDGVSIINDNGTYKTAIGGGTIVRPSVDYLVNGSGTTTVAINPDSYVSPSVNFSTPIPAGTYDVTYTLINHDDNDASTTITTTFTLNDNSNDLTADQYGVGSLGFWVGHIWLSGNLPYEGIFSLSFNGTFTAGTNVEITGCTISANGTNYLDNQTITFENGAQPGGQSIVYLVQPMTFTQTLVGPGRDDNDLTINLSGTVTVKNRNDNDSVVTTYSFTDEPYSIHAGGAPMFYYEGNDFSHDYVLNMLLCNVSSRDPDTGAFSMTGIAAVQLQNGSPGNDYYAELTGFAFSLGGSETQYINPDFIPLGDNLFVQDGRIHANSVQTYRGHIVIEDSNHENGWYLTCEDGQTITLNPCPWNN